MVRNHGYAKVGDRCYDSYNWNARGRENVIGALINNSLTACGIVNGNVDSDVFNTWLEKILIPELPENSVIIMDNAAFHKGHKTKEILSKDGHKLEFLPPYSPDLNLIPEYFIKSKSKRNVVKIFQIFKNIQKLFLISFRIGKI